MPELPEVEITARLLDEAGRGPPTPGPPGLETPPRLLDGGGRGAPIQPTRAPGVNVLKPFAPPLHGLDNGTIAGVSRRGKLLLIDVDTVDRGRVIVLVHLM